MGKRIVSLTGWFLGTTRAVGPPALPPTEREVALVASQGFQGFLEKKIWHVCAPGSDKSDPPVARVLPVACYFLSWAGLSPLNLHSALPGDGALSPHGLSSASEVSPNASSRQVDMPG